MPNSTRFQWFTEESVFIPIFRFSQAYFEISILDIASRSDGGRSHWFYDLSLGCIFLLGLFQCKLASCQCSGVCHMNAEEEQEGFAFDFSGCYATNTVMLFLSAERSFHHCCTKSSYDASWCASILVLIFWLRPLRQKSWWSRFRLVIRFTLLA